MDASLHGTLLFILCILGVVHSYSTSKTLKTFFTSLVSVPYSNTTVISTVFQPVTSASSVASQYVTNTASTTSQHETNVASTVFQHVTSSASTASQHMISSASTASQHVISSATTSQPVISSASTASQHVISSASTASQPVTSSASTASQPVTSSASTASQHVTSSASTASQHMISSASTASQHMISSPSTASQHVISSASTASQPVTSSASTSSHHVISTAYQPMMMADVKETSQEMPVPGGQFIYRFTVTNLDTKLHKYSISVKVDNYMLNARLSIKRFTLNRKQSQSGLVTIKVDRTARPGLERKVNVTITDDVGNSKKFMKFIVIREEPTIHDGNPPELIFLNFVTKCQKHVKNSCGIGNWTVLFSAQDRESGLSIIDVDDHTISTVWTEDYDPGQVIRPINGKVSTDCCQKRTVMIVTDNNGNTIRIPLYFPENSTLTQNKHKSNGNPPKVTAIVVSGFAACMLLVILVTLTVQNWKKLPKFKMKKKRNRQVILLEPRVI